jgi:hypothetical protein
MLMFASDENLKAGKAVSEVGLDWHHLETAGEEIASCCL